MEQICLVVEFWGLEGLRITVESENKNGQKEAMRRKKRRVTVVRHSARWQESHIVVKFDWFSEYIVNIYDCIFADS